MLEELEVILQSCLRLVRKLQAKCASQNQGGNQDLIRKSNLKMTSLGQVNMLNFKLIFKLN